MVELVGGSWATAAIVKGLVVVPICISTVLPITLSVPNNCLARDSVTTISFKSCKADVVLPYFNGKEKTEKKAVALILNFLIS